MYNSVTERVKTRQSNPDVTHPPLLNLDPFVKFNYLPIPHFTLPYVLEKSCNIKIFHNLLVSSFKIYGVEGFKVGIDSKIYVITCNTAFLEALATPGILSISEASI